MRIIVKKSGDEIPATFRQWLEENSEAIQSWINDPAKTGDAMWKELGKTFGVERETNIDPSKLRSILEEALFLEQNGLCCYCGNLIEHSWSNDGQLWEFFYRAIEHFEAKNRAKQRTFDYANLMLCCKESQRLDKYEIGMTSRGRRVNSIEDVQELTNLTRETIVNFIKNEVLDFSNLKAGDIVYVPNPPHCDDEKSKYDGRTQPITIVNPTTDTQLIELLIFTNDGSIGYLNSDTNQNEIIENTLNVLALNCETLVVRRKEKWLNAYVNYYSENGILTAWINESVELGLSDAQLKEIITGNLELLITNKAKPDDDDLLEAFYFVEIAFLKSLFNGQV